MPAENKTKIKPEITVGEIPRKKFRTEVERNGDPEDIEESIFIAEKMKDVLDYLMEQQSYDGSITEIKIIEMEEKFFLLTEE